MPFGKRGQCGTIAVGLLNCARHLQRASEITSGRQAIGNRNHRLVITIGRLDPPRRRQGRLDVPLRHLLRSYPSQGARPAGKIGDCVRSLQSGIDIPVLRLYLGNFRQRFEKPVVVEPVAARDQPTGDLETVLFGSEPIVHANPRCRVHRGGDVARPRHRDRDRRLRL